VTGAAGWVMGECGDRIGLDLQAGPTREGHEGRDVPSKRVPLAWPPFLSLHIGTAWDLG
jgi:hypothetical protein